MNGPADRSEEPLPNPRENEAYLGMLTDISFLVTALESYQNNSEAFQSFTFTAKHLETANIPGIIHSTLPNLSSVVIDLRQEEEAAFISVDFVQEETTLTVSGKSGMEGATILPVSDLSAETGQPDSLEGISLKEFNGLIMSLLRIELAAGFEKIDLFHPETFDGLLKAFRQSATLHIAALTNTLEANEIAFNYTISSVDPTTFSLSYPSQDGERVIHVEGEVDGTAKPSFSVMGETEEQLIGSQDNAVIDLGSVTVEGRVVYEPSDEEIAYLRTILRTEMYALDPYQHFVTEEDLAHTQKGNTDPIDIRKLKFKFGIPENSLDKLSFDPPDSSTT